MDLSSFLAKVLGLYIVICTIGMLMNLKQYRLILNETNASPALLCLTGIIGLVIGLLLVVSHNIWVYDWPVLVTLIGWLSVVKGAARILFPLQVTAFANRFVGKDQSVVISTVIFLAFGIVLCYFGFTH